MGLIAIPTRIISMIKYTGAKSCYIPINSVTLKRRKYAIISYQSKTELKCAARSFIYLNNKKLKWTIDDKNNFFYLQESFFYSSEDNKPIDTKSTGHAIEADNQWKPKK